MKKYLILLLVTLPGCSFLETKIPITQKWPDAAPSLMEKCKNLNTIDTEKIQLSELVDSVVKNYTISRECNAKNEEWINWYNEQKRIYNKVK